MKKTAKDSGTEQHGNVYEIRKHGKAVVQSSIPDCGYAAEQLKSLSRAGYRLYVNGKAYSEGAVSRSSNYTEYGRFKK